MTNDDLQNILQQIHVTENSRTIHDPFPDTLPIDNQAAQLSQKRKRLVIIPLTEDTLNSLFEQNVTTGMVINGPVVIDETRSAHVAGCGHVIGLSDSNTLSAICGVCNQVVCTQPQCSVRCDKCSLIVCRKCASDVDSKNICSNCRGWYVFKKRVTDAILGIHHILSRKI